MSNIYPVLKIKENACEALFDVKFEFNQIFLEKTQKEWLRLLITWKTLSGLEYRLRRPIQVGTTGEEKKNERVIIGFPGLGSSMMAKQSFISDGCLDLGVYSKTDDLNYSYKFMETFEMGIILWFAPNGWDSTKNSEIICKL